MLIILLLYVALPVLFVVAMGSIISNIAKRKGYNATGFFFFGVFLFLPALITVLCLKPKIEMTGPQAVAATNANKKSAYTTGITLLAITTIIMFIAGGTMESCGSTPTSVSKRSAAPTYSAKKYVQSTAPVPTAVSQVDYGDPQERPKTGLLHKYTSASRSAEFRASSEDPGMNYLIKLIDNGNDKLEYVFFVRSGETLDLKVAYGEYKMRYAAGTQWYGEENLFGAESQCRESAETLNFYKSGSTIHGVQVVFYKTMLTKDTYLKPDDF
jgi:hypothetical protein